MGVLACVREGCEKVMCDRYNRDFGYICNGCFTELVEYLAEKHNCSKETIQEFLDTPKDEATQTYATYRNYAEEMFPLQE